MNLGDFFRGFIVLRAGRDLPCEEYVFATRADAERWRELNSIVGEIHEVRSCKMLCWQPSRGTVHGIIILADRLYEVCPSDGKWAPRPNRVFIHQEEE